jgi:predicted GNAT family acetyltransferase
MSRSETPNEHTRLVVVDRPDTGRYELHLDGAVVGFATYALHEAIITVPHVETAPEHRGKDFAARLMDGVIADARARSLKIRPLCGYANAHLQRDPDSHDLRA